MKKVIILLLLSVILSGCVNTPDTVSLQSTIDAAVSSAVGTAIAPYEQSLDDFVTTEELTASQDAQNKTIQQYIAEQIDRAAEDFAVVPTAVPDQTGAVYIDDGEQTVKATDAVSYNNGDCVDRFTYVSDITIPDGMTITPYTTFTKSWYITNSGECTWNSNYKVAYYSGDEVYTAKTFSFLRPGYFIKPGESVMVSADLAAPYKVGSEFSTYWAIESDKGEQFGSGPAKNVYLSSKFRVEENFLLASNFGNLQCSDEYGYFTCGVSSSDGSRGVAYYDMTPMLESRNTGSPAVAVRPPEVENGKVRIEFGPMRMPRKSSFYTNFCCKPDTPTCDVQVRLYVKPRGGSERLIIESREWNDGYINEWKFILDDQGIYDQDFSYIIEIQANGGVTAEDTILIWNTALKHP